MTAPRVVVIGGGLAGIAAALDLRDAGASVVLVERRSWLGGATWSFRRGEMTVDNGQHVYMRCCTEYRSLLRRLGTEALAPLRSPLRVPVVSPGRRGVRTAWIFRDGLRPPFHLARALLGYRHVPAVERLQLLRAVLALQALRLEDSSLDETSFADFLERTRQGPAARRALWELIALPTTNVRAEECSLALAARVFKTGLLDAPDGADLGWADVPLLDLHGTAARRVLDAAGARLCLQATARAVRLVGGHAGRGESGPMAFEVICDGGTLHAEAVVVAVPHEAAARLLPPEAGVDASAIQRLGTSPILDVHVVYDRKVAPFELVAALDSPVQFVFDRTAASGLGPREGTAAGPQYLVVSVSAADEEIGERPEVLVERYTRALAELFPRARSARVVDAFVTREHRATFRARPGTQRLRPAATTAVPGLALAGAWTDTGWPATMEGAVRSGRAAAAAVLRTLGRAPRSVMPAEEVPA
jgi:squalene-associated FAD-dependent desaturase